MADDREAAQWWGASHRVGTREWGESLRVRGRGAAKTRGGARSFIGTGGRWGGGCQGVTTRI
jgi:hypothetical protein